MISTDSHYAIGSSHETCQDYAGHGSVDGLHRKSHHAFLSDGCSGAPDTDWGSRLIVKSMLHNFGSTTPIEDLMTYTMFHVEDRAEYIGLDRDALHATACGVVLSDDFYHAFIAGDGAIGARKRDGSIEVYSVEFESGAPWYPIYRDSLTRRKLYFEKFSPRYFVTVMKDGKTDVRDEWIDKHDPPLFSIERLFPRSDYDVVAVFSDGVATAGMPVNEVVSELMNFKSLKGSFVKRRLKRWLETNSTSDDISMAAISEAE